MSTTVMVAMSSTHKPYKFFLLTHMKQQQECLSQLCRAPSVYVIVFCTLCDPNFRGRFSQLGIQRGSLMEHRWGHRI